ncbi:MAG: molybdopterin-dependent oxidoreductase [Acidobacteriota bacterium]
MSSEGSDPVTPAGLDRRTFLTHAVTLGSALSLGGLADRVLAREPPPWGGERLSDLVFAAEPTDPLGTQIASGLDARLYTDLAKVSSDRRITPVDEFFIRTEVPDQLDPSRPWRVALDGRVKAPKQLEVDSLVQRAEPMGIHLIECAGNSRATRFGLMSTAEWSGVPWSKLLAEVEPLPTAKAVRIVGFDEHSKPSTNSQAGCSWIFRLDELQETGAFLATHMNGQRLTPEHGYPVRLVVPGWYGCCCIKWVERIEWVDGDQPATSQMREFAARTHQDGVPERAADYQPAVIDRAAMPIRVERWRVDDSIRYRVVGIEWGKDRSRGNLQIRFLPGGTFEKVAEPPAPVDGGWSVWTHPWTPAAPGRYLIQLAVDDPAVSMRRVGFGMYLRGVVIS